MQLRNNEQMGKIAAGLLVATCFCVSCTPTSNHYYPVTNLKERNNTLGFSITPPSGSGWYEKLNDRTIYYLKKVPSGDYAIYTTATEINLPNGNLTADGLLKMVERNKRIAAEEQLRNISFKVAVEPQKSPLCVRYTQVYEDHGRTDQASDQHVKIQKNGLVCLHPDLSGVGIDMCYVESSRSAPTVTALSYREEGEFFLKSLRFFPVGG